MMEKYVNVGVVDIDGVIRGKKLHASKVVRGKKDGLGYCDVVFGWDVADQVYPKSSVTGWEQGFQDAIYHLDENTRRIVSWDNGIEFLLGDFSKDERVASACPRTLLKQVLKSLEDEGLSLKAGFEYEWFNFKSEGQNLSEGMFGYSLMRLGENADFVNTILDNSINFNVPLEGLHTETGPGVYEAALHKEEALEAADRAVLFKWMVKELAKKQGFTASFMAKPDQYLPGCSGHLHQSLWSGEKNLFSHSSGDEMPSVLKHFIAGQLYCLPMLMPMYAPTINSYKRYVEGSWAPTTQSWGLENRTTAIRLINHHYDDARIENRLGGADANPYLVLAASIASGLFGIREKLDLQDAVIGNAYEQESLYQLPSSLKDAVALMKSATLPIDLFGKPFVKHFLNTREFEVQAYEKAVTDWEINRYKEII